MKKFQRSKRKSFINLLFFIMVQIFLLTGCQREEVDSDTPASLPETPSRTVEVSPAPASADRLGSEPSSTGRADNEPSSTDRIDSGPSSTTQMDEKPDSETTNETLVFGDTFIKCNMDYFESLCVCVPCFDDVEHLDEDFYAELVNMSDHGPLGDKAEIVDDIPYDKISLADMKDYVRLLFGVELPVYEPSFQEMLEKEGNFYYEDGFYYIGWFDPLDIIYTYVGCESMENGNLTVEFSLSEAVDGTISFELAPAENENGFIILSTKYRPALLF